MSTVLLAVAGQAEIDLANVDALLSDYLGDDDEVFFLFPATNAAYSSGLATVVEFADGAGIPYGVVFDPQEKPNRKVKAVIDGAEEKVPVEDGIVADLIDLLVTSDDDQKAVLLLMGDEMGEGEEVDDFSYALAESGREAGIMVLDLSAGLDEVVIGEAAPEPEPEPAKPARRGRKAPAASEPEPESEPVDLPHDRQGEQHSTPWQGRLLAICDELAAIAREIGATQEAVEDKPRGVPRSTEPTEPYFKHEDGRVTKRGRGRPPKGAEVVHLTASEAADLGLED